MIKIDFYDNKEMILVKKGDYQEPNFPGAWEKCEHDGKLPECWGGEQTKPNKSNQIKSNQIKPNQTKSNQTKPNQTKPYLTNSMIWDINTGQYAGVSREANIKATLDDRVRKQRWGIKNKNKDEQMKHESRGAYSFLDCCFQ